MNTGSIADVAASSDGNGRPRRVVGGLLPPIPTPFKDGAIDHASVATLLDDIAGSVSGILIGGSVGETPSLTVAERVDLMQTVARHAGGELELAVAIGDNSIENSRRLLDAAGEVDVALVVVSLPNYFANDIGMLQQYFGALADAAPVDLCIYDNPLASHTPLSVAEIKELVAAVPQITHIKVTDTALEKVAALRAETDLVIHAGDDAVLWHQLTRGVDGAMVALPMIYPQRAAELWRLVVAGKLDAAYEEYRQTAAFIHVALGARDYVAVVKAVLHERGVIASPEVRLPLVPLPSQRRDEVLRSFRG
jgi:4-hydroxy-tetrahydrodipicolinate synthase